MEAADGRARVVIEKVQPAVDGGRFPIKRTAGETVTVEADIFADGHDELRCLLLYRKEGNPQWAEVPMRPLGNDRWQAEFTVTEVGVYQYTIQGWVDRFLSWRRDLKKRLDAAQDVSVALQAGFRLIEEVSRKTAGADAARLHKFAHALNGPGGAADRARFAFDDDLDRLMGLYQDRHFATTAEPPFGVTVDREKARFSTWYEVFPRSWSTEPGQHGTFRDLEAHLPYIAGIGFDVLYLTPIHPIGRSFRKGKNNALTAGPDDPGSPWGIGSPEGGHKAVHPALGTLEDFRHLVGKARDHHLEVALDVAIQCSPDHPYAREHPEWFRKRPDGTIQYAENPPKKYQDIYPIDFESEHWRELWEEMKSTFLFWIEQGVRIFRVDNPHTKPFRFWAWLITEVKRKFPDVIFLSEAFTRPKVMYRLAKLGFTQSYTYFAWRNTKWELTQYFTELTQTEVGEFFHLHLWPNTPDILHAYLQHGGRPAFRVRLLLAATLGANYGIYGPAFELGINAPREPGSEEYLHSEKYEIKQWNLGHPDSLRDFIARVNRIRRDNPALQSDRSLRFHPTDNEQLLCYSKQTDDLGNVVVMVVNLDPHHKQWGFVTLPLNEFRLDLSQPYQVHDLLTDERYTWHGSRNYVELGPHKMPGHILCVRR